jgi:hypothetical protein
MKTREKVIRKEQEVLGGSLRIIILRNVWATAKMELRCLFLWFKKGLIKMGKPIIALCLWFMVIPWIFHQQDYPYSTEVFVDCAHSRW